MRAYTTTLLLFLTTLTPFTQAQSSNTTLVISQDGNCGGSTGQTCLGSSFGNCCSGMGYCGGTIDYCNANCQTNFGACTVNSSSISSDGRCGSTDPSSQICIGSTFGNCCSPTGWCGSTEDYCGTGCQGTFGNCGTVNGTNITGVTTSLTSSSTLASITRSTNTASGTASESKTSSASSSNATASSDAQTQSDSESSTTSGLSGGAKAGIGIAVALVVLGLIGAIVFVLRRRSRKTTSESSSDLDEKSQHVSSAPAYASTADKQDTYTDSKESYASPPQELHDHREGRAELGNGGSHGHLSELDTKDGNTHTVELPSSKD